MAGLTPVNSRDSVFGMKAGSNSGKSPSEEDAGSSLLCPECGSRKLYRDGLRYLADGSSVQRWLCRDCAYRFSEKPPQKNHKWSINTVAPLLANRQICVSETKNLRAPPKHRVGTREVTAETRAMLRVFEGWLSKEGYKVNKYPNNLLTLVHIGAYLMDPEDVKAKIAAHPVRDGMKMLLCYAYEAFLKMNKMTWNRPEYKQEEIIPFIPEEAELDQLIAAAHSKRMAAFLQTLKETYTDPGEALQIEWDKDINGQLITIRHPVKNHRPRTLEVSRKLIAMINMLPRNSTRVFNCKYGNVCGSFINLKRRVAARTKNNRLNQVELRTFRHWGGTKIAELSNGNPMTVMKMLGLKAIENAMKYVNIWKLSFRTETEYEFLAITTPEELKNALLGGYQFVIEKFGASWFRRPRRIAFAGTPANQRNPETPMPNAETLINKRKPACLNAF